ncbi:diguanylate cyclase [Haloimpatiens sp. FM7315]|uniref:diguanylate cyclase n=1 Tax=Haloimpatiens sp. FM7315 TaxID=3298609 RepID=UPI00370CF3A9
MDIINNRYRVLKFIKQNKVVTSYLVNDLSFQKKVILNIINRERLSRELVNYFTEEFTTWINLDNSSLNKVYDFGVINLIDNKKFNELKYYYTSEYYNSNFFKDINKNLEREDDILDFFIKVCEAIRCFHVKGFTYNNLNLDNIFIEDKDNEYNPKLKDIPTIELEKISYSISEDAINVGDENERINKKISFDIYSLGVVFFYLCISNYPVLSKNIFENENVFLKDTLSEDFKNRANSIIYNCINGNYKFVGDIVEDVNRLFNKNYSLKKVEDIKKLQFNLKLIGRNEELKMVMDEYASVLSDNSTDKIIMVHGETGIGKTKFLMAIEKFLSFNKANVYSNFSTGKTIEQSFKEILKQMVAESDPSLLIKYREDLSKFIPDISFKTEEFLDNSDVMSKQKLKLLNRIQGFINDFTKYKPIVIILDDIHLADKFTIQVLEYLCNRSFKNKSILLMLSYCDGKHVLNKDTLEFVESIKYKSNVRNLFLKGLDEKSTGEMIKYILSMHEIPIKFSKLIYKNSYGNPLFIEEVIKDFYAKGIIYSNEKTGKWGTDYEYHEFPIPSDINEILLNQIQDIEDVSYDILSIISVFLMPVSIENINFISGYSISKIEKIINSMMNKGIICKKIGDEGFVYDLYNKLLKNLIYERIEEEEKRKKHKLAAKILEKQYILGHKEYVEELIYHFEKAAQWEKVIEYCFENAKKMKKLNNYIESIKNLKKAIEVVKKTNLTEKKVELIKEISNMYEQIGEFNDALRYLQDLQSIGELLKDYKIVLYALDKKGNIFCEKNNIEEAKKCLLKISDIIECFEQLEDFLNYKILKIRVLNIMGEYDRAYQVCIEGLELCGDNYMDYKGSFYASLSFIYINLSKIEECEDSVKHSIEIFEKTGNYQGLVRALNNLGVIYGDYYQDIEKSSEMYLKVRELSEKNNLVVSDVIAVNNLAEGYFYHSDYKNSLIYFEEVEHKCRKYGLDSNLFYAYSFLTRIHLKMGNYSKSYEYYKLARENISTYPIYNKDVLEYYKAAMEINFEFGNLNKAKEFIEKSLSFLKEDTSLIQITNRFFLEYIKLFSKDTKDVLNIINEAIKILEDVKNLNIKIELFYKLAVFLYRHGYYDKGKSVLRQIQYLNSADLNINLKDLSLNIKYLEALYDENNKINALTSTLELAKKRENKKLEANIYSDIGRYYFYKEDYFNSFVYYFENCEVSIELIKPLPKKIREEFVKFYDLKRTLNRLIDIKKYYYGENNRELTDNEWEDNMDVGNVNNILSFISCNGIINNKYFMKSVKSFYSSLFHSEIHDIKDVLNKISCNDIENLNLILKYMLYVTMGTNGCIIGEFNENFQQCICDYSCSTLTEEDIKIIKRSKYLREPVLVSNLENCKVRSENTLKNLKACICIPILYSNNSNVEVEKDNRINSYDETTIIAYVYIRSERALNNFNYKTLKMCTELNGILSLIIQKYKLNKVAAYDKLTNTLTRKYLEEEIERNITIAAENNGIFSMIMFDLDYFKNINDKFGHQTGDMVLKKVCTIAKSAVRNTDVCGRYGGEEFIILLKNSSLEDAFKVAEIIRINIEKARILEDKAKVTVSMGIVSYPKHGQWKQQLVEKVDQALYEAKESGRNQCRIWCEDSSNQLKGTNKLTGIITQNEVQNNRNVLVMVELVDIINLKMEYTQKIYKMLGRIIEITESQYGTLFFIKDEETTEIFSRKAFSEQWVRNINYNSEILNNVLKKRHGTCTVDLNNIMRKDPITGAPDWQSIIVVPMIKNDLLKGALYLSTSVKLKEFGVEEFNYVNTLAKIITTMM